MSRTPRDGSPKVPRGDSRTPTLGSSTPKKPCSGSGSSTPKQLRSGASTPVKQGSTVAPSFASPKQVDRALRYVMKGIV